MKKIIVPTDFSPTSGAALRYAYFLAKATGFAVEVVHVHDGYVYGESHRSTKFDRKARKFGLREIDLFIHFNLRSVRVIAGIDEEDEEPEVMVSSRAVIGSPVDTLIATSRRADTRIIVMSSVGTGVFTTFAPLLGKISLRVAEHAACPVFLIPREYGDPVLKRAAIAFNWIGALREVSDGFDFLRVALAPDMRLVHVRDFVDEAEGQREAVLLDDVLNTEFPDYPAELDLPEPGVTAQRLLSYARDNEVDLLVMSRRNRSLFDRLFLRSEKGPELNCAGTPILIIPVLN